MDEITDEEWDEFEQSLLDRFSTIEPSCERYKAAKAYWSKYNHRTKRRRRKPKSSPIQDTPRPEIVKPVKAKAQDISTIIAEIKRKGEEIRQNGYKTPVSPTISWDALRKEIEDRFCQ